MNKKIVFGATAILVITAFLAWLFVGSSKPLPGQKIADLGREHVPVGTPVDYNSNPPTSGPHYADWIRTGVYEREKDDRNLVHSLEHGYIVMSYKCVIATPSETREKQSNDEIATVRSVDMNVPRNDKECNDRKNQLNQVYEKKGKRKLIVVPRQNLDTNFALTAWNYIDKFDPSTDSTSSPQASSGLSVSEIERIEKFIDAYLNQGPERTME